jgi:putative nucleotidyltransferase with HDIG domain
MIVDIAPITDVLEAAHAAEEAGHWDDALSMYQDALDQWRDDGGAPACELLRKIGLVHYFRGDFDVALNLFESSRRIAAENGLQPQVAAATNCLGIVRQALGQIDLAEQLYTTARSLAELLGDERLAALTGQNLGTIASIRGETQVALERYQVVLDRYKTLGDAVGAARALNNIGMAYVDLNRLADAENAFDTALGFADTTPDAETLGTVQLNRAELYIKLERFDDARACCDQAFEIFARLESKSGLGETYKEYGVLFRESGKLHLAEAHLSLVAELAQAADHPLLEAEAESEYALVHLAQGRSRDALKSLNRAHRLFGDLKARRELIDINRQLDKLEMTYLQVVQVWGESIESKDHYTAGHCIRVADYTCKIAQAAGFDGRDLTWLRMGAFLHDVGKTTIDAAMLNKPGSLDPREWEEMRKHTSAGDQIVAELGFPYDIRPMVRSHHERWDGKGYPDQLAGEQIPLTARILCIADVYDALTTTRSYRLAHSSAEAVKIMEQEIGIFDPQLFALFRELVNNGVINSGEQA